MAEAKVKTVVKLRVEGTCPNHSRTDILARDTELTIDEPKERGGTNLGPSPTETMLAALAGCTSVISQKIAHKHGVEFTNVSVDVVSTFDRRGVTLQEQVDVPFEDVQVLIEVTTDADDATMDKIKTELPMFCPVSMVMRQSGSNVTDIWTINRP